MKLIKLSAISSTNDFLRDLSKNQELESFTVVSADSQTKGKGQMGMTWVVESGKNLTISVLYNIKSTVDSLFVYNAVVAISILEALERFDIPDLSVKWPNDILSGKKKIGGILIENQIKSNGEIASIIGIGINVNQEKFNGLPNAGSLFTQTNRIFDLDHLLEAVVDQLKVNLPNMEHSEEIWETYKAHLFQFRKPMVFQDLTGIRFSGMITDVSTAGKLVVQLEDDSFREYGIKEIQMLY